MGKAGAFPNHPCIALACGTPLHDQDMNTDTKKLKAVQLFIFIREYARLSQRPAESLDSYIKTFWLDQIPHKPDCNFVTWAETGTYEE